MSEAWEHLRFFFSYVNRWNNNKVKAEWRIDFFLPCIYVTSRVSKEKLALNHSLKIGRL